MISRDFREFVECLNNHSVRYLIVGGYAVAFHGHPRYTKDLDVWIDRNPDNVTRLLKALDDFGFGSVGLTEGDFLEAGQVIQLGYPPQRIDILTSLTGVEFEECFAERESLELEDVVLTFISLKRLKENKSEMGRYQDLADLEKLKDPEAD